ncbi:DsbC family protein [Acinetobacter sp. MD2(2019)]|uniref:DsbC family protein n=1 Tax=Acinetobacter sp. MD2(2019) TaxID=2605273 RepID=UPI002D1F3FBE|nr:DsbC family protein [Acinetobacter sp. MD2(2019)]MEB3754810.1 DsbC family protein [Acinetobacter sp. MD2(2019)]
MKKIAALFGAGFITSSVFANVAQLDAQLKSQYPNLHFKNIAATEMAGLYSAKLDQQIVYLDESGKHIFVGQMLRLKDQKNLTQDLIKTEPSTKIDWHTLPFQDAIKIVKGNGQHQLAIFEDPNCPYCKQLEPQLDKLENVTLYIFLYPLRPQSLLPSKQVWCSVNRGYAWKNLIQRNLQPNASQYCDHPIDRNLLLGKKLNLVGTPTLIFPNGTMKTGLISAEEIQANW